MVGLDIIAPFIWIVLSRSSSATLSQRHIYAVLKQNPRKSFIQEERGFLFSPLK